MSTSELGLKLELKRKLWSAQCWRLHAQAPALLNIDDRMAVVPPLPTDPAQLAWSVAAMMDIELEQRQHLLEERSPTARVEQVNTILRNALPDLELRAAMHGR